MHSIQYSTLLLEYKYRVLKYKRFDTGSVLKDPKRVSREKVQVAADTEINGDGNASVFCVKLSAD